MRTDTIRVTLTHDEQARITAAAAQDFKRHAGQNVFEPGKGDKQAKRILEGKGAQAALAKHLGYARLPSAIQSRYTAQPDGGLPVGPGDANRARYVHLTGRLPDFEIVGWCWGYEREELGDWRSDVPRPAWFIPQDALRPARTLRDDLDRVKVEGRV